MTGFDNFGGFSREHKMEKDRMRLHTTPEQRDKVHCGARGMRIPPRAANEALREVAYAEAQKIIDEKSLNIFSDEAMTIRKEYETKLGVKSEEEVKIEEAKLLPPRQRNVALRDMANKEVDKELEKQDLTQFTLDAEELAKVDQIESKHYQKYGVKSDKEIEIEEIKLLPPRERNNQLIDLAWKEINKEFDNQGINPFTLDEDEMAKVDEVKRKYFEKYDVKSNNEIEVEEANLLPAKERELALKGIADTRTFAEVQRRGLNPFGDHKEIKEKYYKEVGLM